MKIGDLIRFNAAGQKFKTLGFVLDVDSRGENILIQWCVVGDPMPRKSAKWGSPEDYYMPIEAGQVIWHPIGRWFEVCNE